MKDKYHYRILEFDNIRGKTYTEGVYSDMEMAIARVRRLNREQGEYPRYIYTCTTERRLIYEDI